MKMTKKMKSALFVSAMSIFSVSLAFAMNDTALQAKADGSVFVMEDGASVVLTDDGLRWKVKMSEDVKTSIVEDDNKELHFYVAPIQVFNAVSDGKYENLPLKVDISVHEDTIYQVGEYYYANGYVKGLAEKGRTQQTITFVGAAVIIDNTDSNAVTYDFADFYGGDIMNNARTQYETVNASVLYNGEVDYSADIFADTTPYGWYGEGKYPVTVNTADEYAQFVGKVNGSQTFENKTVAVAYDVDANNAPTGTFSGNLVSNSKQYAASGSCFNMIAIPTDLAAGTTAKITMDVYATAQNANGGLYVSDAANASDALWNGETLQANSGAWKGVSFITKVLNATELSLVSGTQSATATASGNYILVYTNASADDVFYYKNVSVSDVSGTELNAVAQASDVSYIISASNDEGKYNGKWGNVATATATEDTAGSGVYTASYTHTSNVWAYNKLQFNFAYTAEELAKLKEYSGIDSFTFTFNYSVTGSSSSDYYNVLTGFNDDGTGIYEKVDSVRSANYTVTFDIDFIIDNYDKIAKEYCLVYVSTEINSAYQSVTVSNVKFYKEQTA